MSQDAAAQSKAQSQGVKTSNNNSADAAASGYNVAPTDGSISGGPVPPFKFHPSNGPKDAIQLPGHIPQCGIDRARALRKAWLIQTRELPPPRAEPDFDEVEDELEDQVPFSEPVALPSLVLLLSDIWADEE